MNDKVTGIVLKQSDYKENAALVTVLSREYGKFSLVAEGVRRLTSKTASSVQPLMKSVFTIDYRDDRTMFRLKGARAEQPYPKIHTDLVRSVAASVLAECADLFTYDGADEQVYDSLEKALDILEDGGKPDLLITLFLAERMAEAGLSPNVDSCVMCGRTEAAAISVKEGGFLCPQCAARYEEKVSSIGELRAFRHAVKAQVSNYEAMSGTGADYLPALVKITEILKKHSGLELRSFPLFLDVFLH